MQNSFVLVSSLLLLGRFDLIDDMLLLGFRLRADVIEPNVLFSKFVLIGMDRAYHLELGDMPPKLLVSPKTANHVKSSFCFIQFIFSDLLTLYFILVAVVKKKLNEI